MINGMLQCARTVTPRTLPILIEPLITLTTDGATHAALRRGAPLPWSVGHTFDRKETSRAASFVFTSPAFVDGAP
jgi:hypothetical protein